LYVDIDDGRAPVTDGSGLFLPDVEAARSEAAGVLGDFARGLMSGGDHGTLATRADPCLEPQPFKQVLPLKRDPVSRTAKVMSSDEIEERIIGAYIRLACAPHKDGANTATVARIEPFELRLTELPEEQKLPGMPWFWLEFCSRSQHSVIDRCGCTEFDDRELTRLLEFITDTARWATS
jgi:hypothetical protein